MRNFDSFRELMLRKTDDPDLRSTIRLIPDEVIADHAIEALKKMANSALAGSAAKAPALNFAAEMDPEKEPAMIREALGHHASRYKAALKSGDQSMANNHAKHFFNILNLIHKVQPHSDGKLKADMVPVQPWERHSPSKLETFAERIARDPKYAAKSNPVTTGSKQPHEYVIDLDGYETKPAGNDWSFLQYTPHPSKAKETAKTGNTGAYPMEQTKINGRYIPIEDVENIYDGNANHPFDYHPILKHYIGKNRTPEKDKQYAEERDAYSSSPHIEKHSQHQDKLQSEGKLEGRGLTMGEPVHGAAISPAQASPAPAAAPATKRRSTESAVLPSGEIDMSKLSPSVRAYLGGK